MKRCLGIAVCTLALFGTFGQLRADTNPNTIQRVSSDDLEVLLDRLGYKPEIKTDAQGGRWCKISVRQGKWTFPISVDVSKDRTRVWLTCCLVNLPPADRIPPERLAALLRENSRFGVSRFEINKAGKQLWIARGFDNNAVGLKTLEQHLRNFLSDMVETAPLWDIAWATSETSIAKPEEAKLFVSREGRFRVRFPVTPTESTSNSGSSITVHRFMATTNDGDLVFGLAYEDYDPSMSDKSEELLDSLRDLMGKGFRAKIEKETKTTVAGFPARDLTYQSDDFVFRVRLISVDQRVYKVVVSYPKAKPRHQEAQEFINSLQLTK